MTHCVGLEQDLLRESCQTHLALKLPLELVVGLHVSLQADGVHEARVADGARSNAAVLAR